MDRSTAPPQQHKQPSRKGKRAWRKNVDVSEIQEGLEVVREEVIQGGIIAEKSSDALFTLDTTGSVSIQNSYNKIHKPLKADQILAQRSLVPAIDSRKRSGATGSIAEPYSKKRKSNGISPQEYERLKLRAYGGEAVTKDIVKTDAIPKNDPWAEDNAEVEDLRFSYLEKAKPVRAPKSLTEPPVSLLGSARVMPAVIKPRPGISYNPMFDDWDQLLTEEGNKAVEAEEKRRQEAKAEEEHQARLAEAQHERDDLLTEDESAWEGIESEYEGAEWLKKRRPERKTPAERNKVKRRKEAERQAKRDIEVKRRTQQALQIKAIAQHVRSQDTIKSMALATIGDSSDEDIDDRVLRRRKLGKHPLPTKPLELVLPDELQDSLRLLKPEGNLLGDRFRNLMVRGKIESRKPIAQPKKAKRTYTEKWTYKDFTVSA
ncbi:Glioma tumor suppressor candidate region protein 2 [Xylographa opegraphella]|nr:Glioma tumor suppressor candidate region protein 2 [Xylographa opegraphella]